MITKTLTLLALILCSYLPADAYRPPLAPQTEFEQLAVIGTRYGNNPRGVPALHFAILQNDTEAVDLLLKYGASPNTKSAKSHEPDILHACVQAGNLELFKRFVELGCGVAENLYGAETPLGLAITIHQNNIAKFILDSSSFDFMKDKFPEQLLQHCASSGNYEIYDILLNRYRGLRIDHALCIERALTKYQVRDGEQHLLQTDVRTVIEGKFKILDRIRDYELIAYFSDGYQTRSIIANSFPEAFVYLLDRQIFNPDSIFDGIELFRIACTHSEYANEMVDILLTRGVDVQKGDCKYALFTILDRAEYSQPILARKKELILTLLQAGLDINLRDRLGRSLLEVAKDPNMVAFLKSLGAKK